MIITTSISSRRYVNRGFGCYNCGARRLRRAMLGTETSPAKLWWRKYITLLLRRLCEFGSTLSVLTSNLHPASNDFRWWYISLVPCCMRLVADGNPRHCSMGKKEPWKSSLHSGTLPALFYFIQPLMFEHVFRRNDCGLQLVGVWDCGQQKCLEFKVEGGTDGTGSTVS